MVTGDAESYRYLVESIRRFPPPAAFARHDRGGGLQAGDAPAADGRRRRHPFRLEDLTRDRQPRSSRSATCAPASFWPAKARSRSSIRAPCRRQRAWACGSRGSIERPQAGDGAPRLSKALTRLGPSYVKFGQFLATRPDIVGVAAARDLERLQDRMPPFPRAEAVRMVESRPRPSHRRAFSRIQRADRRRLHRAGPQGAHPHGRRARRSSR